jgi:serine/threonine-protein kinase RsbW
MERVLVNIPSIPAFERVVRASASEVAEAFGLSADRIEDLKLAVSEAVTNAIEHGNNQSPDKLVEVLFVCDQEKLEVRVSDQGGDAPAFDFSRRVVEEENLDAGMLRGFGMYLISSLVDDYHVDTTQHGTTMTLRLYRNEDRA